MRRHGYANKGSEINHPAWKFVDGGGCDPWKLNLALDHVDYLRHKDYRNKYGLLPTPGLNRHLTNSYAA